VAAGDQEVAAVSREQATSVSQINSALTQVDEVTQRNAASAEELAATAEAPSSGCRGNSLSRFSAVAHSEDK
jgi:methyl-accepting chemotaxis protein